MSFLLFISKGNTTLHGDVLFPLTYKSPPKFFAYYVINFYHYKIFSRCYNVWNGVYTLVQNCSL